MIPDMNPAEMATVAQLLREAIERDPFPLSPRVRQLRSILGKLAPEQPRPQPYPAPKPSAEPSLLYRKLRGGGRRR
jgi:hypothetical protein